LCFHDVPSYTGENTAGLAPIRSENQLLHSLKVLIRLCHFLSGPNNPFLFVALLMLLGSLNGL
jgi:hypothetical protein